MTHQEKQRLIYQIKVYKKTIRSISSGNGTKKVVGFITPKQQNYINLLSIKISELKKQIEELENY